MFDSRTAAGLTAASQHGLVNRKQLLAAGASDKAILCRTRTGQLERLLPGVYLTAGSPLTPRGRLMAVNLWAGEDAAISYTSAAWLWGLDGFAPSPIHVSMSRKSRPPKASIVLHSCESVAQLDQQHVAGIGVTSPTKTLMDLAGMGHPRTEKALDQCLRENKTTLEQLWLLVDSPTAYGRRGVGRIRDLIAQRSPNHAPTHSELEDLFLRIVRWGRFAESTRQYPFELAHTTIHTDFAYPELSLAIECDSYAWHSDREQFDRDWQRDTELQALGWKVVRLTWAQLRYDPNYVIRQLRALRVPQSTFA